MLRKRYYILFVARDEDGQLRKISLPLHYVYGFMAAALVGAFTIVGLAGSYTRMQMCIRDRPMAERTRMGSETDSAANSTSPRTRS